MKKIVIWSAMLAAAAGITVMASQNMVEKAVPQPDEPMKVTPGGSAIYAWLYYSGNDEASTGYYELTKSGASMQWKRPNKMELTAGWIKDGKLCGYGIDKYGMTIKALNYEEINIETGALISASSMDVDDAYFTMAAYNPETNMIYGYGKDALGNTAFMSAEGSDPTTLTVVKKTTYDSSCLAMTYNPADGKIYGITKGYPTLLVTIAPDGTQTQVMSFNNVSPDSDEPTGLVYSPKEDLFYWNRYEGEESYSSYLCTINPTTKTLSQVRTYSNEEQFSVFVTTDKVIQAGQPALPEITSVSFTDGATSGSMTALLPTTDIDGNTLSGELSWAIALDDASYKTGTAEPGATVEATFADLADGNHTFSITASAGSLKSEKAFVTKYIGNDIPLAPTNVVLTEQTLSWDAVSAGVNNGYVDLEAMEYDVYINGEKKTTTKQTSVTGLLPLSEPLTWYQASVVAICNEKQSADANSNKVLAGAALNLPVNLTPTREEFDLMHTFDLDGDSYSWKCRDGYMESMWSLSKKGGDDWVVLAPINFPDKTAVYSLAFEAMRTCPETDREDLEIRIGTAPEPESMTEVLMEEFEPLTEYTAYSTVFTVAEPGDYYIAFRSTPLKYEVGIETGIFVRNIVVEKSQIGNSSPAAVTDLKAVRGEKGALEATLTFRMPTLSYTGETLSGDVTATVTADEVKSVTGAPGSEQSVTVRTKQGVNVINVTTSAGETAGTPTTIEVYTGVVVPDMVENLEFTISEDMLSVEMKWDAPTKGITEGYVDPETCFYTIYEAVQSFYDMEWVKRGVTKPGETTFTFSVKAGKQACHTLVVMAENVAGHGDDMQGGEVLLGTPFTLPMLDDFENGRDYFQYSPWLQYRPDETFTGNWWVWPAENVVNDGEGNVLVAKPTEAGSKALIGIPAFTAAGDNDNITISLDVLINDNTPETIITGACFGNDEPVEIGKISGTSSSAMQKLAFTLPANFRNAPWVQLYFQTSFAKSTNLLIVDNVKIEKTEGSGVNEVETSENIFINGNTLYLNNLNDMNVAIYSMNGSCIYSGSKLTGSKSIQLEKGIYVVRYGTQSTKIIIK